MRGIGAFCDKRGSEQPVFLARLQPVIFRMEIGSVAAVT
jgi:hypothetical protein